MEKLIKLDGKVKSTYGKVKNFYGKCGKMQMLYGKVNEFRWKREEYIWQREDMETMEKMKILNRTMTNRCEKGRESRWKSKIIYGE